MHGDREFHALSKYVISFLIRSFYSDENFQKLFLMALTKSNVWESGHEVALIVLTLFRYCMSTNYNKNIQGDRELHELSEYVITFQKTSCYGNDIRKIHILTFAFQVYFKFHWNKDKFHFFNGTC